MIVFGIILIILAAVTYWFDINFVTVTEYDSGRVEKFSIALWPFSIILGGAILIMGIVAIAY